MRIASLEPFLTETLIALGLGDKIVAVSSACARPEKGSPLVVTVPRARAAELPSHHPLIEDLLCTEVPQLPLLKQAAPTLVVTKARTAPEALASLEQNLTAALGAPVVLRSFDPRRLDGLYEAFADLGKAGGAAEKGRSLGQKCRAQFMDWADNFYDRTKNKRVTVVSSFEPLRLAGGWIPDLVHLFSAQSQIVNPGGEDEAADWPAVAAFRPDVIVVAPRGFPLQKTLALFPKLEKLKGWEDIPAVKRGEVIFAPGTDLYEPTPRVIDAGGMIVSAIAGLESGYITPRDTFQRLRWLELHRHKIA